MYQLLKFSITFIEGTILPTDFLLFFGAGDDSRMSFCFRLVFKLLLCSEGTGSVLNRTSCFALSCTLLISRGVRILLDPRGKSSSSIGTAKWRFSGSLESADTHMHKDTHHGVHGRMTKARWLHMQEIPPAAEGSHVPSML